ncbi:MAG: bifunctional phosphopantothenoylcysteine decarboxylase/phosphopantothenate--cysteine ligase CoaBC [Caldibacillus debilis]|uniref:Coenzyme A biosynthesis bifunctional protein CoaBC n=1 Tax=Caldibacillus debilis TaxID=301148 RepID=A0A3E0K6K6_9BACI|nr:bifunctional phosphopantothenoylcysteine decarboxylase/phosphopantothenate--cysteine ligase CoaBC [Caldibacillus debilis]REJ29448.1 MAG: bifunctional phosphopantothenoylcysteine decarboxylase/phosphopantothenate--cysteine ligase CoaBC [Caldibacillus debilis]
MEGKKILLCVTGGIAAYKSVALASRLTQGGFSVKVVMTESATKFVTPLTFQAISRNEVYVDVFEEKNPEKIAHIDLAEWPDLILIAPATANIIGKLAAGVADCMVTATLLATTRPVWIAPAMNVHMYMHPIVQRNIETLKSIGCRFIEPGEGYLACGYVGKGRMAEPEAIAEQVSEFFAHDGNRFLEGKTVLVTAGPTRERIDPVRYLSNDSSGKMGYALAEAAERLGARVILVSGPVRLQKPFGVEVEEVESAEEMYRAVLRHFPRADIVIKAAAVADYRPKRAEPEKIKKNGSGMTIELEPTVDILKELGKRKEGQFLVGFAAETENTEEYALKKLKEKNADMIIANNVKEEGAGFGTDTNIVTVFTSAGEKKAYPIMAKQRLAYEIFKEIDRNMRASRK